jgi:hypothetical protein
LAATHRLREGSQTNQCGIHLRWSDDDREGVTKNVTFGGVVLGLMRSDEPGPLWSGVAACDQRHSREGGNPAQSKGVKSPWAAVKG